MSLTTTEHRQFFDFDGLKGRLLSSSYAPEPGQPDYEPMLARLNTIFEDHQHAGKVSLDYDTQIYTAQINAR